MSQDDPFALPEGDRTIIRPAPGGRRPVVSASPSAGPAQAISAEELGRVAAINPLVAAANPLLALALQLRSSATVGDLERLRDTLTRSIREFEAAARAAGIRAEVVVAARYCLCTSGTHTTRFFPRRGAAGGFLRPSGSWWEGSGSR